MVAVDPGNGPGEAGQQDVEVPVVVIVAPGHRTGGESSQRSTGVGEGATIMAIDIADMAGIRTAGQQDVQVSVVVVVAPGRRAEFDARQGGVDVEERAAAEIAVDLADTTGARPACQQDIEVPVVVVVAP